jgi:hypothetical protein
MPIGHMSIAPATTIGGITESYPFCETSGTEIPRSHDPARALDPRGAHDPAGAHDPDRARDPVRADGNAQAGWLDSYNRDGYLVLRGAVGQHTVAACRDHLITLLHRHLPGMNPSMMAVSPARDAALCSIASSDPLAPVAASLLGGEAFPFGCTYFVKDPRGGLPVLWHQDGHPWLQMGVVVAVTLWIPLDPVDGGNGALAVIPGSHRMPARPLVPVADPPSLFGLATEPDLVDARAARHLDLVPGDVSAHHPAVIHGSGANVSDRQRRALAIRYRLASP